MFLSIISFIRFPPISFLNPVYSYVWTPECLDAGCRATAHVFLKFPDPFPAFGHEVILACGFLGGWSELVLIWSKSISLYILLALSFFDI